jgi:hypothetical protein
MLWQSAWLKSVLTGLVSAMLEIIIAIVCRCFQKQLGVYRVRCILDGEATSLFEEALFQATKGTHTKFRELVGTILVARSFG